MCSRCFKLKGHYRHATLKSAKHAEVVGNIVCVIRLKGPEHVRWHAFNKEATRVAWHAFACISDVFRFTQRPMILDRPSQQSSCRARSQPLAILAFARECYRRFGVLHCVLDKTTLTNWCVCSIWIKLNTNLTTRMFSLSQTKHKLDSAHVHFESNSTQTWPPIYSVWVKPNTHLTTHVFALKQTKHNIVKLYVQFEFKWTQTWQHHAQFSSRTGGALMTSRALASHICSQHNLSSWHHQIDIIKMISRLPLMVTNPAGIPMDAKLCVCVSSPDTSRLPTCRHLNHTNDESHHSKLRGK